MTTDLRFLRLVACTLLVGCRTVSNAAEVRTTSNVAKEDGYVVKGTIDIPVQPVDFRAARLLETLALLNDHGASKAAKADVPKVVASRAAFEAATQDDFARYYPIYQDGKVNKPQLSAWITRQVKFSKEQSEVKNSSIVFSSIVGEPSVEVRGDVLHVSYQVLLTATTAFADDPAAPPPTALKVGEKIPLPLNPIGVYFSAMGAPGAAYLAKARQVFATPGESDAFKALATVDGPGLLALTLPGANFSPACFSADPDSVSPYDSFYGFIPNAVDCPDEWLQNTVVTELRANPAEVSYPEYHKLFADRRVDATLYFKELVDNQQVTAAADFIAAALDRGFTVASPEFKAYDFHNLADADKNRKDVSATPVLLTKAINGIEFRYKVAADNLITDAGNFFRDGIARDEVVVYDGHAGAGINVETNFTHAEKYPLGVYQIIVLDGCRTYSYGVNEVLNAKAVRDNDYQHGSVDVVVTTKQTVDFAQKSAVFEAIERAANVWDKPLEEWGDTSADSLTWLSVMTRMNDLANVADHKKLNDPSFNGAYVVTGEVGNAYRPGMTR